MSVSGCVTVLTIFIYTDSFNTGYGTAWLEVVQMMSRYVTPV